MMLDIVSEVEPTLQRKIPDGSPAHLFNMNGKCLSSVNANGYSGQWLVQLDCLAHRDDRNGVLTISISAAVTAIFATANANV